ncbi:hypothetical protein [Geminocystis herdmanii]|uniref:hypothetical protein n=1 Tax=Geminocystis herdmanii TaxID=669359 RepID=UPI000344A8EF|nr:hypothetical protein [Geminocystis herdmanii]
MINSLEFQTKIKKGKIYIPEKYQQELTEEDEITVILLKQPKKISPTGVIAELTENPISVKNIRKLTREDIYNL